MGNQTHGEPIQPILGSSTTAMTMQSAWEQWQKIEFTPFSEQRNADVACTGGALPCDLTNDGVSVTRHMSGSIK